MSRRPRVHLLGCRENECLGENMSQQRVRVIGPKDAIVGIATGHHPTTPGKVRRLGDKAQERKVAEPPAAAAAAAAASNKVGSPVAAAEREYPRPDGRLPFGSPANVLSPMSELLRRPHERSEGPPRPAPRNLLFTFPQSSHAAVSMQPLVGEPSRAPLLSPEDANASPEGQPPRRHVS